MKIFEPIYDKCLQWAAHPKAVWWLGIISFFESIIFPIPVDVMLAPMVLTERQKAWRFALIATVTSVLGAIAGYMIGMWAYDVFVLPLIESFAWQDSVEQVKQLFVEHGIIIIFIAGFSPIPYKIFTLTAGAMGMSFFWFVVISVLARGARYYLVAGLLYAGGDTMADKIKKYIDLIGWLIIGAAALFFILH